MLKTPYCAKITYHSKATLTLKEQHTYSVNIVTEIWDLNWNA